MLIKVEKVKKLTEEIRTNYHSSLREIAEIWDPVLKQFRDSFIDTREKGWVGALLTKPISDLVSLVKLAKSFKSVKVATLPVFGAILVGIGGYFVAADLSLKIVIALISFIVLYVLILPKYLFQMTTLGHVNFHIGAYKTLKPKEYELMRHALRKDFTFTGLYDMVTGALLGERDQKQAVQLILTHFNEDRAKYENKIDKLEEKYEEALDAFNDVIDELNKQVYDAEKAIGYLIQLIKDINIILFRMNNNALDKSDLNIISGYSIYVRKNDRLIKRADIRTTGHTPAVISLDDPNYADYAAVIAVKEEQTKPVYNNSIHGHVIVSYFMKMHNGEKWVFNFHIDETYNEKALLFTFSDDIIETNEIFRLIHALCLLMQKSNLFSEEDDINETRA